ncbi:MAG: hypothetical protein QM704_14835 [Anaeromyxobacteraceae bacterium]
MDVRDESARDRAAELIGKLAACGITNDEFEKAYPRSKDRAVNAVYAWVWHYYDDLHEHRLEGRFALSVEASDGFRRCITFLRSDLSYRWPPLASVPFVGRVICCLSPRFEMGDHGVWPFVSRDQLEEAARTTR